MIKVLHTGDLHFGSRKAILDDVIKCSNSLLSDAQADPPDIVLICGDLYDEGLQLGSPGSLAAIHFVQQCGMIAPTAVIRGTPSHDAECSVCPLDKLRTAYPVFVTERPCQVALTQAGQFIETSGFHDPTDRALISCLPSVTKAHMMATATGTVQDTTRETVDLIRDLLQGFGVINDQARLSFIPTVFMGHGTIVGAVTSTGQQMVGRDLEVSRGDLELAHVDLICFAHIHKEQWPYCGSISRLNFGEVETKGYKRHEVEAGKPPVTRFVETPARVMRTKKTEGLPTAETMEDVQPGELFRLVYTVSEEDRYKVDEEELRRIALEKGASEVKIERTIIPTIKIRAAGISQAHSLPDKLAKWAEVNGVTITEGVLTKLAMIDGTATPPDEIVAREYGEARP